jgi:hypothetical protein
MIPTVGTYVPEGCSLSYVWLAPDVVRAEGIYLGTRLTRLGIT